MCWWWGCDAQTRKAAAVAIHLDVRRDHDSSLLPLPAHSTTHPTPKTITPTTAPPTAEGAGIFRVQQRTPRGGGGGPGDPIQEDVTFVAPMRVLFWKKWARTTVRQVADLSGGAAGTGAVAVRFELLHSDLMSRLEGSWTFTPERAASACKDLSCGAGGAAWPLSRVQYRFCMWPKGVPSGLRRLPGLMDAVQGAVARESVQMLDKMAYVESKMVHPSMPILSALRIAADEVARAGSFKKMSQRLAASPAPSCTAAAAGRLLATKPLSRATSAALAVCPQIVVTAHRLSCADSVDSLPDHFASALSLQGSSSVRLSDGSGGGGDPFPADDGASTSSGSHDGCARICSTEFIAERYAAAADDSDNDKGAAVRGRGRRLRRGAAGGLVKRAATGRVATAHAAAAAAVEAGILGRSLSAGAFAAVM